ncbi:hypothetical protein HMPREF1317_1606 [Schaalia georgiae F0490]|uniref:Uncharacterized protein n=1 Tax=Schaalia georgiae F0490 TaxID=1125717 RepID=J1HH80_9ACTO|nr:hypothetical protein HMPREF1317_1606 [Schaalia georgiae F0490]
MASGRIPEPWRTRPAGDPGWAHGGFPGAEWANSLARPPPRTSSTTGGRCACGTL